MVQLQICQVSQRLHLNSADKRDRTAKQFYTIMSLADDAHEGAGEEDDDAALVEELEEPVVDVTLVEA